MEGERIYLLVLDTKHETTIARTPLSLLKYSPLSHRSGTLSRRKRKKGRLPILSSRTVAFGTCVSDSSRLLHSVSLPFPFTAFKMAYGIDYEAKKATLFDEGTQKFNTTSRASIARAIVGVLRSPDESANKTVYIHDFYTTQRAILDIVESEIGTKLETTSMNLEEVGKESLKALARGERNPQNVFGGLRWAVWGKEASADWDENDDSERLGLEKKDLREEIKKKMAMGLLIVDY